MAQPGEAPAIHDLPIPAAAGAFLIRVKYAGGNPIDYKLLDKLAANSTYPFIMGVDFSGIVERVPFREHDLHTGDRIFGMAHMPSTWRSHRTLRQNRWPVSPMTSLTSRQPRCPSRQLLRSGRSIFGRHHGPTPCCDGRDRRGRQLCGADGAHVSTTVRDDTYEACRLGAEEVYDSKVVDVVDALRARLTQTALTRSGGTLKFFLSKAQEKAAGRPPGFRSLFKRLRWFSSSQPNVL